MAPLKNIVLIGASGRVGSAILNSLLEGDFTLSVLSRASSKAVFPPSVRVVRVADDYPVAELAEALRGQDVVVCAIANAQNSQQTKIIDAAVQAGVKRFIPSDFGSVPNDKAMELLPVYYAGKTATTRYLQEREGKMSWSSIITGPVFDIVMRGKILGIDLENHKAAVCKSGTIKWTTTTLKTVALAVKKVLLLPEETANQHVYIQSFTISDLELLGACEKVTGASWDVEYLDTEEQKTIGQQKLKAGELIPGLISLLRYNRSVPGYALDHGESEHTANKLLGLPEETLEGAIRNLL